MDYHLDEEQPSDPALLTRSPAYEQSISILAPCTYKAKAKNEDTETDDHPDLDNSDEPEGRKARRVLRGFRVAHVAQTDGTGVRPPERPAVLEGEALAGLWDTLAVQIRNAGYGLTGAEIASGANGLTNFTDRTFTIAPHLTPAQPCKTLAHELAHWSGGEPTEVKTTAERVLTTARTISNGPEPQAGDVFGYEAFFEIEHLGVQLVDLSFEDVGVARIDLRLLQLLDGSGEAGLTHLRPLEPILEIRFADGVTR